MTASSKSALLGRLARFGCIACYLDDRAGTPAEIHHLRDGQGISQRASDEEAIPLCPPHHRGTNHPKTPSIHRDRLAFIDRYGTERELLALVQRKLRSPFL